MAQRVFDLTTGALVAALTIGGCFGGATAGSATISGVVRDTAAAARGSRGMLIVARKHAAPPSETVGDLAGRYAVMRGKRDTGCMVTLDNARIRGGERAQLAPGCRDQGIVIFDPTGWQIVGDELVLTARAGHKTHLLKDGVDAWAKDPKDGGKPLGLKKL